MNSPEVKNLTKLERRRLKRQQKQEHKQQTQARETKQKLFFLGGGVLLLVGIVALVVFSGGSSGTQPAIAAEDPILGDPNAPVTIIEYADFQCPTCNRFFRGAEPQIREQFINEGLVKLVWKDFAFIGRESFSAAEAARCAQDQDAFWEYHDILYDYIWDNSFARGRNGENIGLFSDDNLKSFAAQLELDTQVFDECYESGKYKSLIRNGRTQAGGQGVRGTPTFFIDGQRVSGAQPFSVFRQLIETNL